MFAEYQLPDVNLEQGKHIYREYIKELRKNNGSSDTDLKKLNERDGSDVSLNPDFKADPLDVKDLEFMPGVDSGGES